MDGRKGVKNEDSRIAREDEGNVSSRWKGVLDPESKSHDDTSRRIDDDGSNNELSQRLQRLRNPKSSNEDHIKSDKMISTIPDSYSITPKEKDKIKTYLDNCKDRVNSLKERLIDLLLDLAFENIETQPNLATNYRLNAKCAYDTFNTNDLYNYDLNDFVHNDSADYKEINDIVYKLKFINIIYLILQKNASQGDTPSEYKEPVFKYKDLITDDLLNGEKIVDKETFKAAYEEFRKNNPLNNKEQSLPVAKGKEKIKLKLQEFITVYNLHQPDDNYKLKDPENGDDIENLKYLQPSITKTSVSFQNDTRWDRWDRWKPSKDTKPSVPFIQLNMRNILVRINNAISEYNKTNDDDLKTYLLEQIAVAQSFISKILEKKELLNEVKYKLTNFILTYNDLIGIDKYKLQDINTLIEIKELIYISTDFKTAFETDIRWGSFDELKKKRAPKNKNEYIDVSMKDPLIKINKAIKDLNEDIKNNNNASEISKMMELRKTIIAKIEILEKTIDEAIDFIGLCIYIPADAKRIEKAKNEFTKGETVKLTGLLNQKLNNKEATVVEYFKNADMWSVSYDYNGSKKETSVRPSKMLKISPPSPATGGNPPTKYKSTGITVSIMYEKKNYKRTVYTKGNTKTKYCKIDGEYILLSKMKNLSNKNPQRTSPKSRGGGGLDEESDLNAKIKTYLDSSIDTVNFLKHRLVYQLLEYMNSADVKLKFDKDSTNVFEVYKLFKDQGTKGLYVYDLKSFQHYTNEDDIKYKEIDNIVYKLKLINIVYLILKNNSPRDGKLNEYKGNNFKYDLTTLLKEGGTERALDQDLFKADYKEWVNKNKAIENKTPKSAPAPKAPVEEESNQENIKDRLQDFIQVYNRKNQENYKLVDQKKKGYINIQALEYETNLNRISRKSTFNEDTRWDVDVWKKRPVKKDNDIKMKTELININNAIVDYIEAENKNEDLQQKISVLNSAIDAGIVSLGGKDAYAKELKLIKNVLEKQKKGGNPPIKYKSTGITVYILYEKKKYKRTVYTKDNRKTKYCKIDGKYILLSKLNVVE